MRGGSGMNGEGERVSGPLADAAEEVADEVGIPAFALMTDEQAAAFGEEFGCRYAEEASRPLKVLPPAPLLTPELARQLLRECVTVVKPGETLVIRVPETWTLEQVDEYQRWLDYAADHRGFRALAVVGEELGAAQAPA